MKVEFDTSGSFSRPADKTAETQSTGSSSTETPQTNRQAEALPITPKLPLTAAAHEIKFSESLIRETQVRHLPPKIPKFPAVTASKINDLLRKTGKLL